MNYFYYVYLMTYLLFNVCIERNKKQFHIECTYNFQGDKIFTI